MTPDGPSHLDERGLISGLESVPVSEWISHAG